MDMQKRKEQIAKVVFVFPPFMALVLVFLARGPAGLDGVLLGAGATTLLYISIATLVAYRALLAERIFDVIFVFLVAVPAILNQFVSSRQRWTELETPAKSALVALDVAIPSAATFLLLVIFLAVFLVIKRGTIQNS